MATHIARRLVILGAPGSGKGTIASRIVKRYGMPHVVVGDLLRQHIQRQSGKFLSFTFHFINYHIYMIFFYFKINKRKVKQLKNILIKVFFYQMISY